ncbi:MAG: hypothetical protein ACKOEQ_01110, partial [Verrucomicrobiota bacterium]
MRTRSIRLLRTSTPAVRAPRNKPSAESCTWLPSITTSSARSVGKLPPVHSRIVPERTWLPRSTAAVIRHGDGSAAGGSPPINSRALPPDWNRRASRRAPPA